MVNKDTATKLFNEISTSGEELPVFIKKISGDKYAVIVKVKWLGGPSLLYLYDVSIRYKLFKKTKIYIKNSLVCYEMF